MPYRSPGRRRGAAQWRMAAAVCAVLFASTGARAINYSVPYVRNGLPYPLPEGLGGWGATIGVLEVQGPEGNGIDAFPGHRHIALSNFVGVVDFGDGDPTDDFFHGTFVSGITASQFNTFTGVAPFSTYYGAVFSGADTKAAYLGLVQSMSHLTVTAGVTAVNHSWGASVTDPNVLNGSTFAMSLLMDELAGYHGKTGGMTGGYLDTLNVFAAGNDGDTTGLLGAPADSFNGLVVGAQDVLDDTAFAWDAAGRVPVERVAAYSSWRPLADGRAGVHVVAPGTMIWSTLGINYFTNSALVAGTANGTSFAAPHATGVAALLYGASTYYPPYGLEGVSDKETPLSTDHKLIKAILINSAGKIPGLDSNGVPQAVWMPGAIELDGGVTNAVVPLNYAVGSGRLDANEAVLAYRETGNRFWSLGVLTSSESTAFYELGAGAYTNDTPDAPAFSLTATLTWDRHVDFDPDMDPESEDLGQATLNALSNLDLFLQQETQPGDWIDIFMSAGSLGNIEHIHMPYLSAMNSYRLAVASTGDLAEPSIGEQYALAVNFVAIPEPATMGLLAMAAALAAAVRRHRRRAG